MGAYCRRNLACFRETENDFDAFTKYGLLIMQLPFS